jgi:hypothetical protein
MNGTALARGRFPFRGSCGSQSGAETIEATLQSARSALLSDTSGFFADTCTGSIGKGSASTATVRSIGAKVTVPSPFGLLTCITAPGEGTIRPAKKDSASPPDQTLKPA